MADFETVPDELKERPQWLMWDSSADSPRRPQWRGDFSVSWTDPDDWHSFEEAVTAASERESWGIGYVFAESNDEHPRGMYGALDLDGCVGNSPKEWLPSLKPFFEAGAYMEYSPSGTGIHIPLAGFEPPEWWSDVHFSDDEHEGVEAYGSKFFTITGDRLRGAGDAVADSGEYVDEWLTQAYKSITGEDPHAKAAAVDDNQDRFDGPDDWFDPETARDALTYIDPDVGYPTWRDIGFGLADEFPSSAALSLFEEWSRGGSKWDADAERLAKRIINDSTPGGGRTIATVIHYAKKGGWEVSTADGGTLSVVDDGSENDESDDTDDDPEGWRAVLAAYADSDTSKREARDDAVRQLREDHHFATFRDTGSLYSYNHDTGVYQPNGDTVIRGTVEANLGSFYSQKEANEILHRIKSGSYRDRREFGADQRDPKVCLSNGVLSLPDGEFSPHSPDHLFMNYAPVEYDPDAECPNFDSFLHDILETDEDRQLVYEMLGYCLYPGYPFAKSLFMYGDGSNGKSTLLDVFERVLGIENVSSRGLIELEENRFAKAELYRSYANICGDLPDRAVEHTGTFKKLTGGDSVTGEEKFSDPFSFHNTAKLIFSANDPPSIADESNAMYRRLLLLNFPTEFTDPGRPGPDKREQSELLGEIANDQELSGILNRALDALRGVFERGAFSQSASTEQVREQYKKASSPVYEFCNTCLQNDPDGEVGKQELHNVYKRWARENGAPAKDPSVFARELYKHTDAKKARVRRRGERRNVYQLVSLTGRGEEFTGDDSGFDDTQEGLT